MEIFQADKFYRFAVSLKDVPMGCKDAVLPILLLKDHTSAYLMFEENTRKPCIENLSRFCTHALDMRGNQMLEETSKIFNLFMYKVDGFSANKVPKGRLEHYSIC